jgi:hypothetical protein
MKTSVTLAPQNEGRFLPVNTIVELATREFELVHTDQSRALLHLADRLLALKPGVDQQTADEFLLPLAESVEMICVDDPHSEQEFLKCFVVPGEPIEIVFHSDDHEEESAELLDRLARVLDYSVVD